MHWLVDRLARNKRVLESLRIARRFALSAGIPRLQMRVIAELPHDPSAFTQGLCCVGDTLLESTGGSGSSSLRRLDPSTGRMLQRIDVPGDWAEGIAVIGGQVVQLSYQSGIARRFGWPRLDRLQPDYRYDGEGWGLTAVDGQFVMSDGTAALRKLDATFGPAGTIRISRFGVEMRRINDLTWDGRHLFANALHEPFVFRIDLERGAITGVADCRELIERAAPRCSDHVLNGISATAEQGVFFLTGKCWPHLFRVSIQDSERR